MISKVLTSGSAACKSGGEAGAFTKSGSSHLL